MPRYGDTEMFDTIKIYSIYLHRTMLNDLYTTLNYILICDKIKRQRIMIFQRNLDYVSLCQILLQFIQTHERKQPNFVSFNWSLSII